MARIVFKGLTKIDDPILDEVRERPHGAKRLPIPDNNMVVSLLFAIPFMLLCFVLIFIKKNTMGDFPMVRSFVPVGIILGILLCFVHEVLHAICHSKGSIVTIGVIPSRFMFYAKCKDPLSKRRFLVMSLLPIVLGVIPFIVFLLSNNPVLNSFMWPMAMIGLVSPSPDYLNSYLVLKHVPKGAFIQDDKDGLCWFIK